MGTRVAMLTVWFGAMKFTAVFLLMMVGSAVPSPYGSAFSGCEEDHECSGNMFCYKMRSCVDCYNCASYYRKPNAKKLCAKEPTECGDCLDGYEAEILTDGRERDYCRIMKKAELIADVAPSVNSTTLLIVGIVIAAIVVLVAGLLVHRWGKMRYRVPVDQAVQNVQEAHHGGSGNGMSPLLGNVNERKPSVGEQTICNRPSAPPQPPPYESCVEPVGQEATYVMERMKCHEAVCLREPGLQVPSFAVEEQDDQSNGGSDIDVTFDPDVNSEIGYPSALHDDDTLPASADIDDDEVEQSELNVLSNAEAPSFLGVLRNVGGNNSGAAEACDLNDSGLSQASSSVSLSSLSADDGETKCGTPNRSETPCADGSRTNHCSVKRSRCQRDDEGSSSDAANATVDGTLLRITVPNSESEAHRAGDSNLSQASSSASLSSNTAAHQRLSAEPVVKKQKFDSGNCSNSEDLQEDEETCRSQESPRINIQAVTVLNVQNVINYNVQNTFNSP